MSSAAELIATYRNDPDPGLWPSVLAQVGLDTNTGVSLLRMAEAMPRTPDRSNAVDVTDERLANVDTAGIGGISAALIVTDHALRWSHQLPKRAVDDDKRWARNVMAIGHPVSTGLIKSTSNQFICGETINTP